MTISGSESVETLAFRVLFCSIRRSQNGASPAEGPQRHGFGINCRYTYCRYPSWRAQVDLGISAGWLAGWVQRIDFGLGAGANPNAQIGYPTRSPPNVSRTSILRIGIVRFLVPNMFLELC